MPEVLALPTPFDRPPHTVMRQIILPKFLEKNVSCRSPISRIIIQLEIVSRRNFWVISSLNLRAARLLTGFRLRIRRRYAWYARLLRALSSNLNLLAFHQRVRRIHHHVFLSRETRHNFHLTTEVAAQNDPNERSFALRDSRNLQTLRTENQRVHWKNERRNSLG